METPGIEPEPVSEIVQLSREAQEEQLIAEETLEAIQALMFEMGEKLAQLRADRTEETTVSQMAIDRGANDLLTMVVPFLAAQRPNVWQLTSIYLNEYWSI